MKTNGERIVLDASDRITVQVQEKAEESVSYMNPVIPEGYVHLTGECDTGFVIQNKADKSEFVWIPVGYLDPDGTLDGKNFCEKFGRKNFEKSDFAKTGYHEEENYDFVESVKKYGGFYIARYHASEERGRPVFKKGQKPWVDINYPDSAAMAADYAKESKDIESLITSGAAFDSMLRWILKSGAKTHYEVVEDSTSWGNYWNAPNSQRKVMPTGSNENWCVCNIYDIAGNVNEWTSETIESSYCILRRMLRGGIFSGYGFRWPAADRFLNHPENYYKHTSFRVVLYLK